MNQYCVYINLSSVNTKATTTINGASWPGTLIAAPFVYKHNGINYDLNQEGIYKFSVPIQNTTNMIIYGSDVHQLIASLSYMIVPGQTDDSKTLSQITSKSLSSRVNLLCSNSCSWAASQLATKSIQTRTIRCLRANTPNGFYDGHVMLEVYIAGSWKLYDVNLGFYFNASLKDVIPVLTTDTFINLHDFKMYFPAEPLYNNVYHHASTIDMFLYNQTALKNFQKDIMQIPGIVHTDGKTYFYMPSGTESRQSWVQSLDANYVVVSYATWCSMFY